MLGVNPASLYHHFADKAAILHLVCLHVMREVGIGEVAQPGESWQGHLRRAANGYRDGLLRHPNVAPLMAPNVLLRPLSLSHRERVAEKLRASAIPDRYIHPILDSIETLAYGSALLNPRQERVSDRLPIGPEDGVPALARAVAEAPGTADEIFAVQLEALIEGWTVMTDRTGGK
jgi:AcrR family transcriptional regulator